MVLLHPIFLLTSIAAIVTLMLLQGQGRRLRQALPYYLLMGCFIAVLNPLFSHRGRIILFYFMDQPITLEAVMYGVTMMLSLIAILLAFLSYNIVVTTPKFMYLFSAIAPKSSLLTLMTLRFVPLFKRRLRQISLIQSTKGISVKQGSLRKRMKDGMLLLRILLTWSLEEALQTADSMKARGYGVGRRTAYVVYRMDRRDWTVFAGISFAAFLCIFCWLRGYGVMQIYPRLVPLSFSPAEAFQYGCFCLFLLIPIGTEWLGRRVWT